MKPLLQDFEITRKTSKKSVHFKAQDVNLELFIGMPQTFQETHYTADKPLLRAFIPVMIINHGAVWTVECKVMLGLFKNRKLRSTASFTINKEELLYEDDPLPGEAYNDLLPGEYFTQNVSFHGNPKGINKIHGQLCVTRKKSIANNIVDLSQTKKE